MFLAATLFLTFLLILILLRLQTQMAALVAWIVGTISGARNDTKNQEPDKKTTNETENFKPKKSKPKPKRTSTKDPSFSTTLTIPIEEVIEETLNEEIETGVKAAPPRKSKKRNKRTKLKCEKSKQVAAKPNPEETSSDSPTSQSDSQDSSFVPVRDRRKKNPKPKIDDLPKSPLIDQFDPKRSKKSPVEAEFVLIEKADIKPKESIRKKPENFIEIVNKETGKTVYIEVKESKKVHAKISYASVTSKPFEETLEKLQKEEHLKEQIGSDKSIYFLQSGTTLLTQVKNEFKDTSAFIEREIQDTLVTQHIQVSDEKTEELVKEIQSEERRLVDLIEEDHKIDELVLSQEPIEALTNPKIFNGEKLIDERFQVDLSSDIKNFEQKFVSEASPNNTSRQQLDQIPQRDKNSEENPVDSNSQSEIQTSELDCGQKIQSVLNGKNNVEYSTDLIEKTDDKNKCEEENPTEVIYRTTNCETLIGLTKIKLTTEKNSKTAQEELPVEKNQSTFNSEIQDEEDLKKNALNNSENSVDQSVEDKFPAKTDELESDIEVIDNETDTEQKPQKNREINTVQQNLAYSSPIQTQETKLFKMSSGLQVRVLTLNDKEHQDSTLFRLEKDWILQFRLGPSLLGRKVKLYCNYPKENEEFRRHSYNLLKWQQDEGCTYSDDTALLTEITIKICGSFHYYFTYQDADPSAHQGSGFFLVDPILHYGNNEKLSLDCIQCQTFLTKGLGSFDTWENKLKVAKESGYNMIHFTPIQELGASNSSYSLRNQLKVNPLFTKQNGEDTTFQDVENLIKKLRKEWKMVSICDIVLNHTANESDWLKDHPEVTYNCQNCPYLRPSYFLDAALHQFSIDVSKGLYDNKGIPTEISTEDHLNAIRHCLHSEVLAKLKIEELITCDVNKIVAEFLNMIRSNLPPNKGNLQSTEELILIQDPLYRRLASTVDMKLAVKLYNIYRNDCFDEESRIKKCAEEFKNKLDCLNKKVTDELKEHLNAAVDNVIAGIKYFRVQQDGPQVKEISEKNPLVFRYFTDYGSPANIKEHEEIMYSDKGRFLMAHNGWVMNSDPLRNFAAPGSNVYIRRELIAWGDSVKLRFGDKPEDCPFLWQHMKEYVELTAKIFDGVRLDNCHSTPIPVAEYLLDCARKVKPDLYVVAELFTNSDMTDNIFVNRLGITSLIREAMAAWDSHEQGRLVYRYGGSPVGSFYQPRVRPLVPTIAHALFLDLTHDNPSPIEKRSVFDLLPSTALVNMACCASGSNRGYDELVPHHIHVVNEIREYTEWAEDDNLAAGNVKYVTKKSGIIAAKKALNDLHFHLGVEGFNQVYVDQMDPDVVAITRHCPETHESYVLVAFTAFTHPPEDAASNQRGIKPLRIEGVLDEIVLEATLNSVTAKSSVSKYTKTRNFHKDSKWINGLSEYQVQVKQHVQPADSDIFEKVDSGIPNVVQLSFKNFKPGSIAIIKVSLPEHMKEAIKNVRNLISQFSQKKETELWKIINQMALPDLNRALYRCDQEERDEGHDFDTYNIPNFGSLVYAGLQGFMSLLCNIRPNNDLGHPMCANLRDGNWMIDYIWQRLKLDQGTKSLGQWFEENTKSLKQIPRYLVPCYFDVIVTGIYMILFQQSFNLMSDFVKHGSTFVKGLAMGSVQFSAYIKSADLPVLSPNLAEPKPPQRKNEKGESAQACVSLSAGLPHFSVGYMRNWGRDTFIALRGLFLLTGRYQDARYHIMGYAACLRHGLIPNLLDGGRNSRFNCRDAVWWWLYCVKCYTEDAPDGLSILTDKVSRIFPKDDSPAQSPGIVDQPLHDVIQEALSIHFQGLVFRERNAGRQIDEHMTDDGFNNQIGIHPETGFVFGGNIWNCGTWMDKMGSSDKAGNRGKPATPRDGSAIELIGLSKAVITWLDKLNKDGVYPYSGVERTGKNGNVTTWSFNEWGQKIQDNFEKHFWVNITPVNDEIRADLINKRGIYKDCYGASQEWTDFQLRCNFPIAMVVAPELFKPEHAWVALQQAEKYLLGPLGMKTLDPEDWAYNGYYDNSNDSDNHNVAQGFNYHQGPEWVWPVGFYLRAKLQFAAANGELAKTVANTKLVLSKHFVELQTSTWRGLPELTNKDGAYCKDSSRTQAWSMSCILEVLHDLQNIEKKQPLIN